MKRDHKKIIVTFLLPLLVLYAVFQLYPLILNLFYSLLNWNGITKTANFVGLGNYAEVLGTGLFWNAVKNSLLYAVTGTFFQVTVSFFLAYLVEYNTFKKKKNGPPDIHHANRSNFRYDWYSNEKHFQLRWICKYGHQRCRSSK